MWCLIYLIAPLTSSHAWDEFCKISAINETQNSRENDPKWVKVEIENPEIWTVCARQIIFKHHPSGGVPCVPLCTIIPPFFCTTHSHLEYLRITSLTNIFSCLLPYISEKKQTRHISGNWASIPRKKGDKANARSQHQPAYPSHSLGFHPHVQDIHCLSTFIIKKFSTLL